MKKRLLKLITLSIAGISFCMSGSAFAQENNFYLGAGMAYHAEEFNADVDYDNTYGLNLAIGYDITSKMSLEAQMDKLMEFDTENPVSRDDVDLRGYSLNLKYYPGESKSKINGYVLAGLGWMKAELTDGNIKKGDDSEETGYFGKLGVGSDFVVTDIISFYMEADYVQAFGDLNPIDYYSAKIGFKIYP